MDSIIQIGRIVFFSLFVAEIFILLFRFSTCRNKKEFLSFLLVVVFLGIKTLFSHIFFLSVWSSYMLIFFTGKFVFTISPGKYHVLWTTSVILSTIIVIILMMLKINNTIYFSLFYFYSTCILLFYPSMQWWRLYKQVRLRIFLYLLTTSMIFVIARALDYIIMTIDFETIDFTLWISIALITGLGYLLFQKGYLLGEGFIDLRKNLGNKEKTLENIFSRVIQTEDTLLLQDRLIASGLLSTGTSHEYKNILTQLRVSAEYGLKQEQTDKKNEAFTSILKLADDGITFVANFYDIISLRVEEKPSLLHLKNDLSGFFRLIRVSLRKDAVAFYNDIDEGVSIYAGKGELEQILLNLIRNATDSLKKIPGDDRRIELRAKLLDAQAIIEVRDNGEGIPQAHADRIFEPHFSMKKSSGLGLYLVQMLVNKNGGNIEYIPQESGACFRLIFPSGGSLPPEDV